MRGNAHGIMPPKNLTGQGKPGTFTQTDSRLPRPLQSVFWPVSGLASLDAPAFPRPWGRSGLRSAKDLMERTRTCLPLRGQHRLPELACCVLLRILFPVSPASHHAMRTPKNVAHYSLRLSMAWRAVRKPTCA